MRSVVQDHLPGLKSSEVFYGFRKGVDENENAEGMNAQRARRQGRDTEPKNRTGCLAAQKDRRVGKHRAKERNVEIGRATWRESGGPKGKNRVVAGTIKKTSVDIK